MIWAVIVFLCILILFFLVLCVPLQARCIAKAGDSLVWSCRVIWLFGLLSKDISTGSQKKHHGKQSKKGGFRSRFPLMFIYDPAVRNRFLIFSRRMLRTISFRDLDIDLKVGLDDPANTWMIAASAVWITLFLHPSCPHAVSIQPCFTDEFIIKGAASVDLRIVPITAIIPAACFVFSGPVVKMMVNKLWKRNSPALKK